jgi:predicted phosphodiesterase
VGGTVRYLILSDLHSNLEASRAALDAARREGFDRAVVLGDLVGYGADPEGVVDLIRTLAPCGAVRGNHDKVVIGASTGEDFNPIALEAARRNRLALSPAGLAYLRSLPRGPAKVDGRFLIAHGTPGEEDDYLVDEHDAKAAFGEAEFRVCFFGHTHVAGYFVQRNESVSGVTAPPPAVRLAPGTRYLINPGSVGQPRDGDPRAAFALYDETDDTVWFRRVEYPVPRAQERILEEGLPPVLAARLERGI